METLSRKVELKSGGSTELLVWFILIATFIFLAISTGAVNNEDLTIKTNRIIPDIHNILKTSKGTPDIFIRGRVSRKSSIASIGLKFNSTKKRSFR
ncbi:MAG: hypothetical protein IH946_01815 [Bacteroidetes bacterium]|nr:hypothetical protein [Bacteroidota bacterium]